MTLTENGIFFVDQNCILSSFLAKIKNHHLSSMMENLLISRVVCIKYLDSSELEILGFKIYEMLLFSKVIGKWMENSFNSLEYNFKFFSISVWNIRISVRNDKSLFSILNFRILTVWPLKKSAPKFENPAQDSIKQEILKNLKTAPVPVVRNYW